MEAFLVPLTAALAVSIPALATGWAQSRIGPAIAASLAKGEDVRLAGFGAFETRERAARTGRNPQTGEEIAIAASTSVGFKAAAQLKRAVNG